MFRVLTKTFLLLLYLEFIKNSPEEPFMLSVVKKMCTYRDSICKGEKITICTARITDNTVEYKSFSSSCYLFLSNICDQPRKKFNIISEGSCINLFRRKSVGHTEEYNEIESEQSSYKYSVKKKLKKYVRSGEIEDMAYENLDDDDKKPTRSQDFNFKEANDSGKENHSPGNDGEDNIQVTLIPKVTSLDDARGKHSRNNYKYTKSREKNQNHGVQIDYMLPKKDSKREKKSDKSEESESKVQTKVIIKDKTKTHSHDPRYKYWEKYKNKNKKRKNTKKYHSHHQHHEKPITEKTKLRHKRHSVQRSKFDSHSHTEDNEEKAEEFQSVNADDNNDKTPEDVSSRNDEDNVETKEEEVVNKPESKDDGDTEFKTVEPKMKVKDAEEENDDDVKTRGTIERKKLKHSYSNETNDMRREQNISVAKDYNKKDMERTKDCIECINKSSFIISEKLLNKSENAFLMLEDNATFSGAEPLYKPLTGNVFTNEPISIIVDINGTTPNSIPTFKDTATDKKLKNDFTESFENFTNSVDNVLMKANDNKTNQIISNISGENDGRRNDKSGEENHGTENISARGINTDKSVSGRSSENHKVSDHFDDKKDNNMDMEIIEKSDTTTANTLLDYVNVESLDIDEKFHDDVRDKLIELNLTAANIDQYNETLMDIADLNHLIDTIDFIHTSNKERTDKAYLGLPEEKLSHTEVENKPNHSSVDKKQSNLERDVELAEFIAGSIDRIGRDRNVQDNDNPLMGDFRRDLEVGWMDMPDLLWM